MSISSAASTDVIADSVERYAPAFGFSCDIIVINNQRLVIEQAAGFYDYEIHMNAEIG